MSDKIAISVQNVSKNFKLPHEKPSGLKQAIIKFRPGKKYEVQHVLENISFDIHEGEFFGIVGRNGSGKSTLLKLLAQIYVPNKGSVTINGSLTPFIELGVGFNAELTGRENVYLNGALLGFDRKQVDLIYDDIVEFAEIERFMDQKLKNYSSGMQVRLAFSIAIRAESDILLVDEVLAVGDAAFQQKCFNYFEKLKENKRTVVFVSHDMAAVQRFCNRAVYIDNGKLTQQGNPSDVANVYALENIKSGTIEDNDLPNEGSIKGSTANQTESTLLLDIAFEAHSMEELYAAISVIKNGISVAEINSKNKIKMVGKGVITYELDTTVLNPGVYEITVVLCKKHNGELIGVNKNKIVFVVSGVDDTRGGALRLKDVWK